MAHLPDFLESFRAISDDYVRENRIQDINFSGPTYQVEVIDRETQSPLWVFLQLEDDKVKDLFCSCEASSQKGACEHMAAASRFIFSERMPFHKRYEASFWHALFFQMRKKCGLKPPQVRVELDVYTVTTSEGELLFSVTVKGRAKEKFDQFFQGKGVETEETSIKFSNLTDEELDLWRKGWPSENLRFELSFLSDIAKFLFLKQNKNSEIVATFTEVVKKLPAQVSISLPQNDLTFDVPLTPDDLLVLIPTLQGIKSNLLFFHEQKLTTTAIEYNPKKASFYLYQERNLEADRKPQNFSQSIILGRYHYVPALGFYEPSLSVTVPKKVEVQKVKKVEIHSPREISELLHYSLDLLQKHLPEMHFCNQLQKLQYQVRLDAACNLHIEAYLFEEHDLVKPTSHLFFDWVYIEGKGFFKTDGLRHKLSDVQTTILKGDLSQFVLQNRSWLGSFKGFEVHIAKMQQELSYRLDEALSLWFFTNVKKPLFSKNEVDIGEWVYRKGEGFFLKEAFSEKYFLPIDKPISSHHISDFIRRHYELLQGVKGFFMQHCPVKNIGLKVHLKKKGLIEIVPDYEWVDEKETKRAHFFDEFVYVQEKGFFRLSAHLAPLHYIREISSQDPTQWNSFFLELLPKLKSEFICHIDPRLEQAQTLSLVVKHENEKAVMHEKAWDLDLYFQGESGSVLLPELITSVKNGERFLPTKAGCIDLSSDRFHWLKTLRHKRSKKRKQGFHLSAMDLFSLHAYEPINFVLDEESKAIFERLLKFESDEVAEYPALQCDLRHYQKNGVDWLYFLYKNSLSGLLCDDMGVGKTHQAMGLMAAITHAKNKASGDSQNNAEEQKTKSLFIVVCPTSLVYHWQDKIHRFLPSFRVKAYTGALRTLDDFPGHYDVLVTSYGLWRNEYRKFRPFFFDAAFFDELQIAKNHVSQIYAALQELRAHIKIGLTGTPIENQLRELKALFDLVLPGYMPQDSDFREFFVRPIEKDDNKERRMLLGRFVKPFVLRRRKQDVLPELPEKTEDFCYAELIGEQKTLYKSIATKQASPLIQLLKDDDTPIPYMHIFALLASLKQICNHPAAYLRDVENYERYESGKWEAFVELLEEAEESEQKVVVFSQYLAMLDIMQAHLIKNNIQYAQIRGETRARGEEIERFNTDPKCRVFLGSLQAAGLGIDLTAGSVVIHYDRWWNAARENQATDRVHRIGQTRGVQVFKMITKATVEEKINLMIARKQNLLEDIVTIDDHQILKRFTRDEIISLLEGLGREG